ncbi:MAG: Mu transposase C-terminal domain-containing protein [Proteobacteria bacterium]|nr:Mu transposase C-terminal domain-containing protein [Pseudomonadota bacterium]
MVTATIKAHYSAAELAAMKLSGFPTAPHNWRVKMIRENWPFQDVAGHGGKGGKRREYQVPADVLTAIHSQITHASKAAKLEQQASDLVGGLQGDLLDYSIRQQADQAVLARLPTLSPKQQRRFEARRAVVMSWHTYLKLKGWPKLTTALYQGFCDVYPHLFGALAYPELVAARGVIEVIKLRSLQMWVTGYQKSGLEALVDELDGKHRKGRFIVSEQAELNDFVIGLMIAKPHIKITQLFDAIKARFAGNAEIALPSETSLTRFVKQWKAKNAGALMAMANPDAWKNKHMVAFGEHRADRLNQWWEFDSTPSDVMLTDGRYQIQGVIDAYSRRVKLLVSKTSTALAMGSLFRSALLDWGVPEMAKTDNGQEYVGKYAETIFSALGIEQHRCPPFQPWHKPHIERFFKTFSHGLMELLEGYIGHNVADRKELEARAAFSERLFEKDGVLEVSMSSTQLQAFCDNWINNVYHHDEHGGLDDKTPFQMAAEWNTAIRRIDNPRVLDVLLAELGAPRIVGKKGIQYDNGFYIADVLALHVNNSVQIKLDPTDLGRIYVFDDCGAFICIAEDPQRTGMDRQEVAMQAKAMQLAALKEAKKALRSTQKRANTDDIVQEILLHRATEADQVVMLPKKSVVHSSHGMKAADEALQALDTPHATGGLSDDLREGMQKLAQAAEQKTAKVLTLPETPDQRFKRWLALDQIVKTGGIIDNNKDQYWYGTYPQGNEWKAQNRHYKQEQQADQSKAVQA